MSQCLLPAYLVIAIDVTTCRRRVEHAAAVLSCGYSSILNDSTYHFKLCQPQVTDDARHAVNVTDMNRAVRVRVSIRHRRFQFPVVINALPLFRSVQSIVTKAGRKTIGHQTSQPKVSRPYYPTIFSFH